MGVRTMAGKIKKSSQAMARRVVAIVVAGVLTLSMVSALVMQLLAL